MKQEDSFGAPTTSPSDALAGINDFVEGFVGYEKRSVNVLQTADNYPDSALANIHAGMLWMFLERPEAVESARPYRDRARKVANLNAREQGLLMMLDAWMVRDHAGLLGIAKLLLERHPQDLSTLKVAQYHAFNSGNAELMLQLAELTAAANEDRAPWYSILAFGYEQSHQIDSAETAARQALALDQNEPWAHHAMAHIHLSRGDIAAGKQMLVAAAPSWEGLNSFMYTHNWWHLALFEIAEGRIDAALSIHDRHCWGVEPDYSQDQIGSVSLLARLEMAGADVGDRWLALRPYLETRVEDVLQPFLCVQYLYGLARAESPLADHLLRTIDKQAEHPLVAEDQLVWQEVGIPLAHGLMAHTRGRYARATARMSPVMRECWRLGGSHAQRDLFAQLYLDALVRSGERESALKRVLGRLCYEPDNPALLALKVSLSESHH